MNASLSTVDGRQVLRFEKKLAHPPEKVWSAITELDPHRVFAFDEEGDLLHSARKPGRSGQVRAVWRAGVGSVPTPSPKSKRGNFGSVGVEVS